MVFFLGFLLTLVLLDIYGYQAIKTAFPSLPWLKWVYVGIQALLYGGIVFAMINGRDTPREFFTPFLSFFVVCYLPKLFIGPLLLAEDIGRGGKWLMRKFNKPEEIQPSLLAETPSAEETPAGTPMSRNRFVSQVAMGLASIPFGGALYGVSWGKYHYQLRKMQVEIEDLPKEFEGFTITQISDLHTGSFDDKKAVQRGIELINRQDSDVIFFTGDMVNELVDEVQGFEDLYRTLYAKNGVYSVLGNHDYGRYADDLEGQALLDHNKKLQDTERSFGWNLLMNENAIIQRGDSEIAIVGVENWSDKRFFPKNGDLQKAMEGTEEVPVKLLLSHDPTHWDAEIRKSFPDIDMTFSGHTHGSQFGIEIPGFRWSPVQYMYDQWAGLYQEGKQYLYVNRGLGFLGFSGRIGIQPEITVIELKRKA